MFSFLMALFGYLTARLVWDYIRTMARRQEMMPIQWAGQVAGLLLILAAIAGTFGIAILFAISRGH